MTQWTDTSLYAKFGASKETMKKINKVKFCFCPHHEDVHGGGDVAVLTSASALFGFTHGKEHWCQLYRRLGVPRTDLDCV